jgi:hypothetical protein
MPAKVENEPAPSETIDNWMATAYRVKLSLREFESNKINPIEENVLLR